MDLNNVPECNHLRIWSSKFISGINNFLAGKIKTKIEYWPADFRSDPAMPKYQ